MLRKRKNKRYNEETHDEEDDRGRRYNIRDKIRAERFERVIDLQELPGHQVTLKLIQRNGFDKPILVTSPDGLDLSVPSKGFVVRDVGKLVGYDRMIDVMDVRTQKNIEMTMRDWCKYYESRNRDRLLNVISLEFSHTELASQIDSPKIVKLLDWVDLVWPKFLKESQTESTNTIDKMKYPKVQKYCLMSVKGSYTDFHIDFGGTSVWYHILRGKKIFWMAPPTELNLQAFEEWTLSGMQQDVFFGDTVDECFRVELTAGNTFFIPSGWIHAVYTLEDSLVFGGNFLHSFGIENQLKVSRIEDATKVPVKFRYPFYTEILWYVVQHYVYCLTGKSHLQNSPKNSTTTTPEKNSKPAGGESKNPIKKRSKVVNNDSATESEHDDSDKTKRKKTVTPPPSKRKRGRPPKRGQKPPTDDESTEIDSEYEDTKPTKSTTTCRMTKNSLLRLQYELDEPQAPLDRNQLSPNRSASKQTKSLKSETSPKEANTKASNLSSKSPKITEAPIKSEMNSKLETQPNSSSTGRVDLEASDTVPSGDTSRLNGWSGANKAIWSNSDSEPKGPLRIHLTKTELNGLKLLVKHLSKLSGAKKNMPNLIRNSRSLLDDCKKVIAEHENDDPEMAVTGIPITPDLLNPKKSDINQLIEQFFKPTDANLNDEVSNDISAISSKSRSDSSTLTMQHRLKYNQINNHGKVDDKKNSTPANESAPAKVNNLKDTKSSGSAKKSSSSTSPTSSSNANSSSSTATSLADQPRPKSPPTRPLSNKQYSSRTKNDKSDSSLVLPGSFADLIAATSTINEVFNVSSADVTSSLFGLKSPTKPTPNVKDKQQTNLNNPKKTTRSPFDIDIIASTTTASNNSKNQTELGKDEGPKPNSPEPPKLTPTKRFITPASNRPQVKEKLIFASAPYVSPVHASDHQRYPYPWQNSTNSQASQHRPNLQQQQQSRQPHQYHGNHGSTAPTQPNDLTKTSPSPTPPNKPSVVVTARQSSGDNQVKLEQLSTSPKPDKIDVSTAEARLKQQVPQSTALRQTDAEQVAESPAIEVTREKSLDSNNKMPKDNKSNESQPKISPPNATLGPNSINQSTTQQLILTKPIDTGDDQKIKKPRGPPKKSKEARLAIETIEISEERARQAVPISVIKLNTGGQQPVIVQRAPPPTSNTLPANPSNPLLATPIDPIPHATPINPPPQATQQATDLKIKGKSKAKRAKKHKDEPSGGGFLQGNNSAAGSLQTTQTRPPVIRGLVPSPTTSSASTNSSPQLPKAGQQYLISRPVLFNSMPAFSSAHLPHLPRTSMPVFTTPMPTSMGLHNMQPGARILWATRPRDPSPIAVTSAPTTLPRPTATHTQTKKQAPKTTTPTDLQARQPDNAALLSLATTALSTAPLPTTPTLTNIGSRLPNPAQAYMVNPNMFAAQQYYNPYMQQIPMVQFAPRDTAPSPLMAGAHFRPGPPRQLLFAPLVNQTGQPRYLITQPGFMPHRPQAAPLYSGHQPATTLSFAAFQPASVPSSSKETAKVKKVKTR